MIIADKIMELRKKNGWSQEELAEQLHVSRQSVSKWEGAQSVPDINKVIAMASLFGVTTDYLLKDEIDDLPFPPAESAPALPTETEAVRRVSMEESNLFLAFSRKASGEIALGVLLCILSPILVILLAGAGELGLIPLNGDQGGILGSIVLLLMVAAAIFLFVKNGMQFSKFDYLEKEMIETEYGVSGMVRERRQEYEQTHLMGMALGIILCVLSSVPVLVCTMISEENEMLILAGVSVLLMLIGAGVYLIVRVSIVWDSFQKLLEEGDYTRKSKRSKNGLLAGLYWSVVTAGYLAYSFVTMKWDRSWIIWPIAGVLYAAIVKIDEALLNRK